MRPSLTGHERARSHHRRGADDVTARQAAAVEAERAELGRAWDARQLELQAQTEFARFKEEHAEATLWIRVRRETIDGVEVGTTVAIVAAQIKKLSEQRVRQLVYPDATALLVLFFLAISELSLDAVVGGTRAWRHPGSAGRQPSTPTTRR